MTFSSRFRRVLLAASSLPLLLTANQGAARWPMPPERGVARFTELDADGRRRLLIDAFDAPPSVALPLVERGLGDEDPGVRHVATQLALAASGQQGALESWVEILIPWLTSPEPVERADAARLLAPRADLELLRALVPLLSDYEGAVRRAAVEALAELPPELADVGAEALGAAMNDPEPKVRQAAARSLGLLASPSGMLALVTGLRDDDPAVRAASATALGAVGQERGLDALVETLDDAADAAALAAVRSLALHPSSQREAALLHVAEREPFDAPARAAVEALVSSGGPRTDRLLTELLGRPAVGPVVEQLLLEHPDTGRDWGPCLRSAVGDRLRACGAVHLAAGGKTAPLKQAVSERRLSEEDFFRLAANRKDSELIVRALRLVSIERLTLESPLGQAALDYLLSLSELPAAAASPLESALDQSPTSERATQILTLLARLPATESWSLEPSWLEAEAPEVRSAAAAVMAARGVEGEPLSALLTHRRESIARGVTEALSRRCSAGQRRTLLTLLTQGTGGRLAERAVALEGNRSELGTRDELLLQSAIERSTWALHSRSRSALRAREALLTTAGRWGSPEWIFSLLPSLSVADRTTLTQALELAPRGGVVLRALFDDPSPRVAALAMELGATRGVQPPDQLRDGAPGFLRAAWWRAQAALASAGGSRVHELRLDEACLDDHPGVSAAAWGLAALAGEACAGKPLSHALRPNADLRTRRSVAHAFALRARRAVAEGETSATLDGSTVAPTLVRCILYDPDVLVSDTCERAWRMLRSSLTGVPEVGQTRGQASNELQSPKEEAPDFPSRLRRVRLDIPWAVGSPSGVPVPLWQGDQLRVLVSDRVGELWIHEGPWHPGDASLGY